MMEKEKDYPITANVIVRPKVKKSKAKIVYEVSTLLHSQ